MTSAADLVASAVAGDKRAKAAMLAAAGGGCIETQRAMLMAGLDALPVNVLPLEMVLLARMVAARGDHADARRLAGALWLSAVHGHWTGAPDADELEGEAIALLTALADDGDGESLEILERLKREASPGVVAAAEAAGEPLLTKPPAPQVEPPPLMLANLDFGPPLTRAERLRFWLVDGWWNVRFWIADRLHGLARAIG